MNIFIYPSKDVAERHNLAQDFFSSRREWKHLNPMQYGQVVRAIPPHIIAYVKFHPGTTYEIVLQNIQKFL